MRIAGFNKARAICILSFLCYMLSAISRFIDGYTYSAIKVVSLICYNVIYFHNAISLQGTQRNTKSNSPSSATLKNACFSLRDHSWQIMEMDHRRFCELSVDSQHCLPGLMEVFCFVKPARSSTGFSKLAFLWACAFCFLPPSLAFTGAFEGILILKMV